MPARPRRSEWLGDERFAAAEERLAPPDQLVAPVAGWTEGHTDA